MRWRNKLLQTCSMKPDLSPTKYQAHVQTWDFGQIHVWFTNSVTTNHSRQLWSVGDILLTNQLYQEVVHQ